MKYNYQQRVMRQFIDTAFNSSYRKALKKLPRNYIGEELTSFLACICMQIIKEQDEK